MYYQLRCKTCNELFSPLVATSANELLFPDYEEAEQQAGPANADRLRAFHKAHHGHEFEAVTFPKE